MILLKITNKNLLCSRGNSTQYSVITYTRKESKKRMKMCICITEYFAGSVHLCILKLEKVLICKIDNNEHGHLE